MIRNMFYYVIAGYYVTLFLCECAPAGDHPHYLELKAKSPPQVRGTSASQADNDPVAPHLT